MSNEQLPEWPQEPVIGVVGLGYVGLPLAVTASGAGLHVIGFDISEAKVHALSRGRSHVEDVGDDELVKAIEAGATFTSHPDQLAKADAIVVAVPSPLGRNRQPDLSFIEAAADTVATIARPGQLVSLESTTYPGTTEEVFLPRLEARGLVLDRDVWVCFSPERVDPGNVLQTAQIPKIVGGVTQASTQLGVRLYERLVEHVHPVSSARAAELTKLLENTYRAVNIAMVNEMAQLAHILDIDIWEVIDAAATKPFGFQAFHPGPGVGGHCIPLDPQFLAWRAREFGAPTRFIDLAEQTNLGMPHYVADRVAELLNERARPVRGSTILGVGLSYKRNVGDDRESPAADVLRLLQQRGADVVVYDPHVPDHRVEAHGFHATDRQDYEADVALILTDHDAIDLEAVASAHAAVFDTRGAYRRLGIEASSVVVL